MSALFILQTAAVAASPQELLQSGIASLNAGDLTSARTELEQVRDALPNQPQLWLALTEIYSRQNEVALREQSAARAISLAKAVSDWEKQGTLRHYLAKVELANAQYDQAIADYRAAVEQSPYEEAFRFDLAQALLGHQRFREAVDVLEAARKVFDKSAQLTLALGVAYYGQRRFPDAMDAFLKTIDLAPEVAQPYVFLGRMLDQAGNRLPDVERRFAEFSKAYPDNYLGYLLQAKAMTVAGGDSAETEKLLNKSISIKGDNWESHFELGVLFENRRDFRKAAAEFERSAALNPDPAQVHYHLARVYDRLGKTELAKEQREIHAKLTARETISAGMEVVR